MCIRDSHEATASRTADVPHRSSRKLRKRVLSPEPEASGSDDVRDDVQTPDASDSEEETADEDGDEVKPEPSSLVSQSAEVDPKRGRNEPATSKEQESLEVPPPRRLPFKTRAPLPEPTKTTDDEDETDDEL